METSHIPPQEPVIAAPALLPLWATVRSAYSIAWGYRREYLRIIWLWFAIMIPIVTLYNVYIWPYMQAVLCVDFRSLPDQAQMDASRHTMLLATAPLAIFRLFIGASIAVAWHRLVLRNEHIPSKRYLRMDGVVLHYFTVATCIWFMTILINLIGLIEDHHAPFLMMTKGLLMIIGSVGAIIVSTRLTVILPAKALERSDITIGTVWQITSWNFWRLFAGNLLCFLFALPLILIGITIRFFCDSPITGSLFYTLNTLLAIFLAVPVYLTFLSLAYQHFFEPPAANSL